jgi:hypothetical protein
VELLVGTLVVLALVAIALRFVLRSPDGAIVLPRIVDQSIGMWVVREIAHRLRPGAGPARPERRDGVRKFDAEMAGRLGIRRAGQVAAAARSTKRPLRRGPGDRRLPRPLALAVLVLLAIGAGAILGAGAGLLTEGAQSHVLGVTGTPAVAGSEAPSDAP